MRLQEEPILWREIATSEDPRKVLYTFELSLLEKSIASSDGLSLSQQTQHVSILDPRACPRGSSCGHTRATTPDPFKTLNLTTCRASFTKTLRTSIGVKVAGRP